MKKIEIFILAAIILIAFTVRLYKIDRPIADWHSWRQADTAAVARNFIKEGYNPFIPKFDDLSSQTNGLNNPDGFRFVEFPIYNSIIFIVWKIIGISTISARLITVVFTTISTLFLYLIVKKLSGIVTAAASAFFFATIPYNVFYSSTILPGPFMVFCILGLYFFFLKYLEDKRKILYLALSIFFANLAILSWPIALFFLLPLVYIAWDKYKMAIFGQIPLWVFALTSITPFIAWRFWMLQFPEGIPSWRFIINEGSIRFKHAFFRWLFAERLGKLILSVSGFALFAAGLMQNPQNKEKLFYFFWLLATGIYFVVFASGNVRHDYYQIPAVPILCIFLAKGALFLFKTQSREQFKIASPIIAVFLIISMYAFTAFEVRGYYWVNNPKIVEAGLAADRLLPKNATVIAPYGGDTAFLYQTNRRGYPVVDRELAEFVNQGTKYLVSVDPSDEGIQNLAKNCKVLDSTEYYIIIELATECIGK